jgi:amino ABC transporter, permease protein, 3-TM region, his/glu/gln/arg/opine family
MTDFAVAISDKMDYIEVILPTLLSGAWVTTKLFVLTLILSLPLGLVIALASISKIAPFRWISKLYIWIFRGTPLMLQLFFFYFFIPIGMGIALSAFATSVLTFVLNYAAYFAEIYRGGIESIDRGQYEAAKSLGLSKSQTMFGIILPQTIKRIMPAISNEAIVLVKDTALAFSISVAELLKAANSAMNRDQDVTAFVLAALMYLAMTFVLTVISDALEYKYSKHEVQDHDKKKPLIHRLLAKEASHGR